MTVFACSTVNLPIIKSVPGSGDATWSGNFSMLSGLKVGLYYSLIDWHHPDYPNVGNHPQRGDVKYAKRPFNWDNYLKYMHGQIEELVKNYGKLDIMWFDFSFNGYSGEKWKAKELLEIVRKYQPYILIDNRLTINNGTKTDAREISTYGDFETPEQGIPDEGLEDKNGNPVPWETCMTLNNNWGYCEANKNWKSPQFIIQCLVNCVSKNGNMLLNVGPDARGNIPEASVHILQEVEKWMDKNSESIYGCGASKFVKGDWGRYTQKGNTLYAHWMVPDLLPLKLKGIGDKVDKAYLLGTSAEVPASNEWWGEEGHENLYINFSNFTFEPDTRDVVFKMHLKQ